MGYSKLKTQKEKAMMKNNKAALKMKIFRTLKMTWTSQKSKQKENNEFIFKFVRI